jgi:uncharacterized RDD family membrane protein YckC
MPGYAPGYGPPGYVAMPRYAGFWIRFVAWIIDSFVCLLLLITLIGPLLYFPLMWWQKGATLGQMALNLRVVRAEDGGPIDGSRATVRAVVFFLEWIGIAFFYIGLLGFIWAAFEPRKRAWHDMAAGTGVIQV